MTTQVIVLNGGSSSGKSGIVRCLQAVLRDPWLAAAVDSLIEAMPASMQTSDAGIEFAADGGVNVGSEFRELEAAWMEGVAAMARAGARVIVDDVFLGGATSQERWQKAFGGLDVLWVGVRCESTVAAGREVARGDRVQGMAASQAEMVHRGVVYDLEVDTTHTESLDCARAIAAQAQSPPPPGPSKESNRFISVAVTVITQCWNVLRTQLCPYPDESKGMPPLPGLHRGVGRHLDHDLRLDLRQRFLRVLAAPWLGVDLVRPRVAWLRGTQQLAELGGLFWPQRYGAADDDQVVSAVPPGDHHLPGG